MNRAASMRMEGIRQLGRHRRISGKRRLDIVLIILNICKFL